FFFSSRRRHTRFSRDWSSDVCSSDLVDGELVKRLIYIWSQYLQFHPFAFFHEKRHLFDVIHVIGKNSCHVFSRIMSFEISGLVRSEERRVGKEGRYRALP